MGTGQQTPSPVKSQPSLAIIGKGIQQGGRSPLAAWSADRGKTYQAPHIKGEGASAAVPDLFFCQVSEASGPDCMIFHNSGFKYVNRLIRVRRVIQPGAFP